MKEYVIAIELGSSKIVAAAASRNDKGELTIEAIETESVVNIVKRGCVQNIEEVYSCVKKLRTKLENRLSPAKIIRAYVGIGGVSTFAEDRVATKAYHEDSIIEQPHVQKLMEECREQVPTGTDVLTVVPVKYIIDGRAEVNPIGVTGTNIEAHYKVITAKPVLRRNIDRCLGERLKLPIAGYITAPLATADVILSADERQLGCVLVDFGAETTTVSIYKGGSLVWLETLPMGGRNITRDIASLNLVESEAEHLKIASGMAKGFKNENNVRLKFEGDSMVEIDLAKLSSVVEARSEEIVANVEEQIKRSGLARKDLTAGIVVVGSAAKLRGWTELLEERIGIKVRVASLRKDIKVVEKERTRVNDFLTVVGLLNAATELCTHTPKPLIDDEPAAPTTKKPPVFDDDDEPEEETSHDGEKKPGLFDRIRRKFGNFINEGESEDEEDDD